MDEQEFDVGETTGKKVLSWARAVVVNALIAGAAFAWQVVRSEAGPVAVTIALVVFTCGMVLWHVANQYYPARVQALTVTVKRWYASAPVRGGAVLVMVAVAIGLGSGWAGEVAQTAEATRRVAELTLHVKELQTKVDGDQQTIARLTTQNDAFLAMRTGPERPIQFQPTVQVQAPAVTLPSREPELAVTRSTVEYSSDRLRLSKVNLSVENTGESVVNGVGLTAFHQIDQQPEVPIFRRADNSIARGKALALTYEPDGAAPVKVYVVRLTVRYPSGAETRCFEWVGRITNKRTEFDVLRSGPCRASSRATP